MPAVKLERQGRIAIITLNRPDRLNAMGKALMTEMALAFTEFEQDRDLSVAILTGTGRGFCVGLDIKEHLESGAETMQLPDIHPVICPFYGNRTVEKPVISAVNGLAMGGGFYLALQSDLIVASDAALFEISEIPRGGVSGWEVGYLHGLPLPVAFELATGGRFTAQRLHQLGLVNEVAATAELLDVALRRAEGLLRIPPQVLRYNTELTRALRPAVPPHVEKLKWRYFKDVTDGPDADEAMRSFMEKRPPIFSRY